jgi:CHAD domain-containing protein
VRAGLPGRSTAGGQESVEGVAHDRTPQERDQGLHEVRESAKRARYAAESAVPVSGKPATRLAERMESL